MDICPHFQQKAYHIQSKEVNFHRMVNSRDLFMPVCRLSDISTRNQPHLGQHRLTCDGDLQKCTFVVG